MNASKVGLELPRIWCISSCLFLSPAFSGMFACEMCEKSPLNRTEGDINGYGEYLFDF